MKKVAAFLIPVLVSGSLAGCFKTEKIQRISRDELKAMLGNPDLVILDVRSGTDWEKSNAMIRGAVREDPGRVESWMHTFGKDKKIVLYCA